MRVARRALAACLLDGVVPEEAWFDCDPRAGGQVLCVAYTTDRTWAVAVVNRKGRRCAVDTGIPVRRVLEFRPAGRGGWRLARTLAVVPPELLDPSLFVDAAANQLAANGTVAPLSPQLGG
jgi:hypothetical protein